MAINKKVESVNSYVADYLDYVTVYARQPESRAKD